MVTDEYSQFGQLLRKAREAAGLSQGALAQRVELDASHIHRLEVGGRHPSRESALALAEALGVRDEALNAWLLSAGYAPMPLLTTVRAAIRTRGTKRHPAVGTPPSSTWDSARWAQWLEAMGLHEGMVARLLQAMEPLGLPERQVVINTVSATFTRVAEMLEAPVQTAIIPAAGGQHRLLAAHVMQRLLVRAIAEAAESGISRIALVLAPGTIESLYMPLKETLELAIAPSITLQCVEQPKPYGLGDAILQAEAFVNEKPFVVLLPDDVVPKRIGRMAFPRELRRMIEAFKQLAGSYLIAVAPVTKSKMPNCGVCQMAPKEAAPSVFPIRRLVENPEPTDSICRSRRVMGIVGRYLLQPDIFCSLHQLRTQEKGKRPLDLTAALARLLQERREVYAFKLAATRQDIGEVLGQASELIGHSSE